MRSTAGVCRLSSRQSGFVEGDGGTTSRRSCKVVCLTKSSPDHKLETASMSHTCGRRPPSRPRRLGERKVFGRDLQTRERCRDALDV
jgi:hypothetical protein